MPHSLQALRLGCLLLFTTVAWSQEVTLTGKIIDQNTAREISGVKISLRATGLSTLSDRAGRYTLKLSRSERESVVVLEHPDYQTREMTLGDLMWEKDVALVPLALEQQETVLTGSVRDQTTQREIAGVKILLQGTALSTTSDAAGKFSLSVPGANRGTIIVFQHADYHMRELSLNTLAAQAFVELTPKQLGGTEEIAISGMVRDRNTLLHHTAKYM